MTALLGYAHDEFLGKELWEIGLFRDKEESQAAYRELQEKGYIRYEHLPLKTKSGQEVEVEFVSNVYQVDQHRVVQCNIRDITERSRLERQTQEQAAALADLHRRKDEFLAMLSPRTPQPARPHPQRRAPPPPPGRTRTRSSSRPAPSSSGRWGNWPASSTTCWKSPASPRAGSSFDRERLDVRGVVERAVETARPLIDRRRHDLTVSLPPRADLAARRRRPGWNRWW